MHVDMDAFYASVEQLDHSEFRGKPVIVGADPAQGRGVVSTASYEAREYGIHSAMPITQAFRACPNGIFLQPRFHRYKEISSAVFKILGDFSPSVEPISIDEAFVDLTGTERLHGPLESVGKEVKKRILAKTGVIASVGIAPNKFLAKLACGVSKPDGFIIIKPESIREFLDPLPIKRMWGIGPATEKQMVSAGINTIKDLIEVDESALIKRFGNFAAHLRQLALGIDDRDFSGDHKRRGISIERTYREDVVRLEPKVATLRSLADRLAVRMRKAGINGRTITVKVRHSDFTTVNRGNTLPYVIRNSEEIYSEALRLATPELEGSIRLIGIRISGIIDCEGEQLGLFDREKKAKIEKLEQALDEINTRFGDGSISRAKNLKKLK